MGKSISVTFTGDPRDGETVLKGYRRAKNEFGEWESKPVTRKHKADDPDELTLYDMTFPRGKAVKIDPESEFWQKHGSKFIGNSHFTVKGAPSEGDADKPPALTEDTPPEAPADNASRA